MSTAASITVKKNDGTTDVIYGVLEGRSGDNPARWKAPALGASATTQPEFRVSSKVLPAGRGKVIATFAYPYHVVNSTTGVTTVENREMLRFEYTGDLAIPQATRDEACSQGTNLLNSALFKTMLKELMAST